MSFKSRKKFFFSSSFVYMFKMWNLKLMLWKACGFISSPHRSTIGARSDQMASKSLVETQVHYLWVGNLPPYPLLPSITVKCFYFFMRHHVWEFSLVFSVEQLFGKDSKYYNGRLILISIDNFKINNHDVLSLYLWLFAFNW